jgi:hypothetical protein
MDFQTDRPPGGPKRQNTLPMYADASAVRPYPESTVFPDG